MVVAFKTFFAFVKSFTTYNIIIKLEPGIADKMYFNDLFKTITPFNSNPIPTKPINKDGPIFCYILIGKAT